MIKRVLVANRGEIALRIVRACREEGVESVAVYSEADHLSPHVTAADHAVQIGPPPAPESYLAIPRLLDAARTSGADAVHPGYGFLAERAEFAEAVHEAGLVFIGPSAAAIRAMGEKTEARRRMQESDVPVVPGSTERIVDADHAATLAAAVGYPILLKAVAGGGGKGMRRVESPDELPSALRQASSEALKAFGNGDMYVERCIERPRHVEIQILGDRFGNVVHFGERECSIQRRHQKLIEESPSPAVNADLRARMGDAAVRAASSVQYEGAGTVEFLLEADGRFHFLEMNTRIQVEHPITELVYGVDLVRQQLRIAAGHSLEDETFAGSPTGHAIECRITSEDPYNAFLPDTGTIDFLRIPSGPGVRWDGGVAMGNAVGLHYDPLLAKLIVWAGTRSEAIARMRRALDELIVVGVSTSQPFHSLVLAHEAFASGDYDTGYLGLYLDALLSAEDSADALEAVVVAAALAEHDRRQAAVPSQAASGSAESDWLRAARRDGLR